MITDNLNEVFDIVDINDKVIGQATRGEVHKNKKMIHRSVGIAVFNSNGKIFLQRRSLTKDTDALLWTVSCSGHVQIGDTYENSAIRELKEELGISGVRLVFLTKYLFEGKIETEMTTLYKVLFDGEIILEKEEIWEGRFFSQNELLTAVNTKELDLNTYGKIALSKLGFV